MPQRRAGSTLFGMTWRTQTAVFLVRAWREEGDFRARVRCTADVSTDPADERVTADPAEVRRLLDEWLDESAGQGPE